MNASIHSVLHGELLTIRLSYELVICQNFQQVYIESDSLIAICEINKTNKSLRQWVELVLDIFSLAKMLHISSISYVKRETNLCSHELPKMVKQNEVSIVGFEVFPGFCCNFDSLK